MNINWEAVRYGSRQVSTELIFDYFWNHRRAERSSGHEYFSSTFYFMDSLSHFQGFVFKESKLVTKIALPIIGALLLGFGFCKQDGRPMTPWLQDFSIEVVSFATFKMVSNNKDLSKEKKNLYTAVIFAVSACAFLALDKSRNPSLPFTPHCVHIILTRVVTHNLRNYADKTKWCESDRVVRDIMIQQVASIALALSIQSLMRTHLKFNWKMLGIEMVTKSIFFYALYSPSSPIVKKMFGR